jgi:hypothetical protein
MHSGLSEQIRQHKLRLANSEQSELAEASRHCVLETPVGHRKERSQLFAEMGTIHFAFSQATWDKGNTVRSSEHSGRNYSSIDKSGAFLPQILTDTEVSLRRKPDRSGRLELDSTSGLGGRARTIRRFRQTRAW